MNTRAREFSDLPLNLSRKEVAVQRLAGCCCLLILETKPPKKGESKEREGGKILNGKMQS